MDNKFTSQIKRGLKVTSSYLLSLVLFGVFLMPLISIFKENNESAIFTYSIIIFLLMFSSIYIEMSKIAFKEKRPQYNINPPPFKGLLYGFIGIIPLVLVEVIIFMIKFPEDLLTLHKRIYQGFAGPLYWFAKVIGNEPVHYLVSFILVVIIAGLGYFAGHKNFYLIPFLREKLGINKRSKKANRNKK
ncbi:MAG: hypothetical protein GX957_15930 [Clostridiaceae bacterium]|nr:hypothetical protein [Clostridiaceae bacterium]